MQNFEQIRTHIAGNGYRILMQEPYVMCVELSLEQGTRHQAIFLSEMKDDDGRDYQRVSTAVAPTTGLDARRAGLPGRARMVARVLRENGDANLPWHRVLRSDGRIAFPPGSKGYREQSQRLRAEGVDVRAGRVRIAESVPDLDGDLDAALWRPR